jgi:hypothetical protein
MKIIMGPWPGVVRVKKPAQTAVCTTTGGPCGGDDGFCPDCPSSPDYVEPAQAVRQGTQGLCDNAVNRPRCGEGDCLENVQPLDYETLKKLNSALRSGQLRLKAEIRRLNLRIRQLEKVK